MKFFTASSRHSELHTLRNEGVSKGISTGWNALDEIYTVKKGYPLFIAGSPHHGKSEFALDLMVNLSKVHAWKHFVYAGEIGSADELISEIAHKYIGKPFRKKIDSVTDNSYAMDEGEMYQALDFIDKHFVILDTEDEKSEVTDFTPEQFYALADEAEKERKIKFDCTLLDPFNDVVENLEKYGGREDKFLKDALKLIRSDSKRKNRLNIVINHIADITPVTDKHSGSRYIPVALPTEWAGGRTWHRRAFTMLLIYRPPILVELPGGGKPKHNETWVINQKAKPKGSGKLGQCSLYWDWKENKFYDTVSETANISFDEAKAEQIQAPF